eukprot:Blabericola_migrator_1__4341@NODE_2335_length_2918_cov_380_935812_g1461_i0_p2_GENE_NODE_2335_length_2918_cov_380_935812_g1461_i0NODE_2335_length_2918_cov_380_935812_g1461_i0_p2_ORF_typecomplete_len137_score14_62Sugar_tr/PF00083_24/2_6e18MFS_1/PF07690_16/0_00018LacY_symp/PF01306_19/0_0011Polysacc_synt_3/PF13440_6/0_0015CstA/PF02554_14/0_0062Polysacc_synt/PF01943_17/0_0081MFS_2/PF13347_6/0_23ABC2_membrane_5/PF13346_6/0_062Tetraspanin/PF00335_20/0_11Rhomboid/PF01694_22/0_42DUF4229/PF14012_6/1_1e03D
MASSTALFSRKLVSRVHCQQLINCVMTLPAVPLIERLGRKTLLLIGCIGMTVGVAPAAICYWAIPDSDVTMYLAIVGCFIFIICFAATYGPILWSLDNRVNYTLFMIMSAIGTAVVGVFMLETKGRALGDSPYIRN